MYKHIYMYKHSELNYTTLTIPTITSHYHACNNYVHVLYINYLIFVFDDYQEP